jgi:hypothetical protein
MTSPPSRDRATHILEVRTRGLLVEVRLNDIPIFTENVGRGRLFQVKCAPYLVNGENELRAWLRLPGAAPGGDAAPAERPAGGPHYRARIVRIDPEAGPAADSPVNAEPDPPAHHLADYAWDPANEPLVPGRVFEVEPRFFFAEAPGGGWSWETAPVFQPAGEDPAEIRVVVEKLWRAVAFRDADAVVHLTREKTRELAVALGVNAGELESDQASYLVSLFTSPNWMVAPLEQDGLILVPAARGRLVEVRTVDGEAPIRGGDGSRAFVLRPMVARIDGRWRIVR